MKDSLCKLGLSLLVMALIAVPFWWISVSDWVYAVVHIPNTLAYSELTASVTPEMQKRFDQAIPRGSFYEGDISSGIVKADFSYVSYYDETRRTYHYQFVNGAGRVWLHSRLFVRLVGRTVIELDPNETLYLFLPNYDSYPTWATDRIRLYSAPPPYFLVDYYHTGGAMTLVVPH